MVGPILCIFVVGPTLCIGSAFHHQSDFGSFLKFRHTGAGDYPKISKICHTRGLSEKFNTRGLCGNIAHTIHRCYRFLPWHLQINPEMNPQINVVLFILVDKPPVFGRTLMTRGCFGTLRLAAARPIWLHACSATVRFLHAWRWSQGLQGVDGFDTGWIPRSFSCGNEL